VSILRGDLSWDDNVSDACGMYLGLLSPVNVKALSLPIND